MRQYALINRRSRRPEAGSPDQKGNRNERIQF